MSLMSLVRSLFRDYKISIVSSKYKLFNLLTF